MQNEKYKSEYLPLAHDDVHEILDYILNTLNAPMAAANFADELDEKVALLEAQPYIGATYKGNHKFDFDYRFVFVGNYTLYYVILEDKRPKRLEIHRIIYSARNMEEQL
jgi:plasmid stabilization system protein ParE